MVFSSKIYGCTVFLVLNVEMTMLRLNGVEACELNSTRSADL